ncbi:MAG: hypothetical protein LAN70_05575 [Acidobacteriia bacterium]|nr:hypothetical protein [Terriglobia bacterium]
MKKRERKPDLTLAEIADLRKRGLRDEVRREIARQAKRFFSQPETTKERAERIAFTEAARKVLARDDD